MSILDRFIRAKAVDHDGELQITDAESSQDLVIVPMRRAHIRKIMPIEQQVYPRPWTPQVFVEELEQARVGKRHYLVGTIGDELVGYGGLLYVENDAHVTNIAVDPMWRSRGIATELLLDLAWEANRRGCEAMTLEVRHTNVAAQQLYRRFGFVPAGVRKKYYENRDDAIVMWCAGVQEPEFAERLRKIELSRM
ncbi:MAG: ribosomal protein S18-alanine N-acetyltransferase [Ilumatobacteraceae bacterium]|jgi:ribosomal-protein-alanine N-acetyltransferase|nr:ribosomal protein S18-alanine N-acetyltransferase [Actinomycetota bacterium]MDP4634794.1 ribosomal protein S18-alanine N-acetyltransferase [Ilumatobacteraceae bacterium]HBZ62115.1 ribosomal-protein-alanine N-acetyltransferase [Acidimicrobium sp.]MDA2983155.1 ribosomal protein S18-alanine N-acetyltransferase [Actinomycetota bacterium]MDA3042207.1 ribosomal protein S18-alanine N-acetyltransferase [Actinomycetota bacterium]